jgi:hypothetical protein
MKRIVALVYKSYKSKDLPQPYFRSMMTIVYGIMIISLLLSLKFLGLHVPKESSNRPLFLLEFCSAILAVYFILSLLYSKRKLETYYFSETQIKKGWRSIIIYLILLNILVLVYLILRATKVI